MGTLAMHARYVNEKDEKTVCAEKQQQQQQKYTMVQTFDYCAPKARVYAQRGLRNPNGAELAKTTETRD